MSLIVIHKNKNSATGNNKALLRFALASEPIANVILDGLSKSLCRHSNSIPILRFFAKRSPEEIVCAIPEGWSIGSGVNTLKIIPYTENIPIGFEIVRKTERKATPSSWFVISNGRFATQINSILLQKVLAGVRADVVAVNVVPELLGKQEKLRLTAQGKVAGFRRLYSDSVQFASVSTNWPHHLFVKTNVLDRVLTGRDLSHSFSGLIEKCRSNALTLRAINVGGTILDLETEDGLLNFCGTIISKIINSTPASNKQGQNSNAISRDSRLIGKVLLGKNVRVSPKTIIVGPTIIGNNVKIEQGAVINSSIIGPDVSIPRNQLVQNCIVKGPRINWKRLTRTKSNNLTQIYQQQFGFKRRQGGNDAFRNWPRFSYPGCIKRVADCFFAIIVLILFAPIIPFIALAIKFNSPGPVFFKDKRQGLYGKAFNCIKFRTMTVGAEEIQDKLRFVSQVDGPQFKIADDPRISAVGRFLRETYLDEIPQFINVLLGQMSVVGPRPSPESENTLCPYWRDARLSVRPGITGLWQICRTRQPMKDFQEWIHYDVEYVRNLSLKMDLWISWQTTKKLIWNFISQF